MKFKSEKVKWIESRGKFIKENASFIFTDFQGLSGKEMTDLRQCLRQIGARAEVVKNRLFKRVMESEWKNISAFFAGPTAVIYFPVDSIGEVCKALSGFAKANEHFKIKGGFLRPERVLTDKNLAEIASIPDRNTLLASFARALQSPLYNFYSVCRMLLSGIVFALNDLAKKKVESV